MAGARGHRLEAEHLSRSGSPHPYSGEVGQKSMTIGDGACEILAATPSKVSRRR